MAYDRTSTLVVRQVPRPRGLSGIWDDITSALSSGVTGYNAAEQQQGAMTQAQLQAMQNQSSINPSTILLLGVGVLAVVMISKKKKAAT